MLPEQFISRIETEVLQRPLGAVERWVVEQSLQRRSYGYMARSSNYSLGYLKIVGATLWNELSAALGRPITKKNLEFVFPSKTALPNPTLPNSLSPALDWYSEGESEQKQQKPEPDLLDLVYPGGPVPIDSLFYIERADIEVQAYQELQQPGALLRIRGPAKTGKTSLVLRLFREAKQLKYRTVSIDFQSIDQAFLEDHDRFFRWICANIGSQLKSELKVDDIWDDDLGANVLCTVYLEAVALSQFDAPLLLLFNAVDRVLGYEDIAQDFLSLIRFWYEQAKQHLRWRSLRQVLTHSTEVYIPLSLDRSPFNVGLSLRLPPFTQEQVRELAQRYNLSWAFTDDTSEEPIQRLMRLTGGHPYLLRLALHQLAKSRVDLSELLMEAKRPDGFYRQHVQQQFAMLSRRPQLSEGLQQIMTSAEPQIDSSALNREMLYHLECAGLIARDGHSVRLSCDLYRMHFQNLQLVS